MADDATPTVSASSMKPAKPENGATATPVSTTAATSPPKTTGSARKRRSRSGPASEGSSAAKGRKKKEPDPVDFEWAGRAMFVSRELGYETPEAFIDDCKAYATAWDRVHGK